MSRDRTGSIRAYGLEIQYTVDPGESGHNWCGSDGLHSSYPDDEPTVTIDAVKVASESEYHSYLRDFDLEEDTDPSDFVEEVVRDDIESHILAEEDL